MPFYTLEVCVSRRRLIQLLCSEVGKKVPRVLVYVIRIFSQNFLCVPPAALVGVTVFVHI